MRVRIKLFCIALVASSQFALAHPGRTASDGCHYCRTNCSSWGVPWNERHCHGRASEDPVEKLMSASGLPHKNLVSVGNKHSHEREILK